MSCKKSNPKSDIKIINELLAEEMEGVEYYEEVIESAEDPELIKFAKDAIKDEKAHVNALYSLLGKKI